MMELIIHSDGTASCIYEEAIPIRSLGSLDIKRASHVEPDETGEWLADLSPVGGPTFRGFGNRTSALEAEIEWLTNNWLCLLYTSPSPRDS